MWNTSLSLNEILTHLQMYRIDSVIDITQGEIRTKHFVIRLEAAGTYTVTEKELSGRELIGRVTAREITEKKQQP